MIYEENRFLRNAIAKREKLVETYNTLVVSTEEQVMIIEREMITEVLD
jgi:hypothetical protein